MATPLDEQIERFYTAHRVVCELVGEHADRYMSSSAYSEYQAMLAAHSTSQLIYAKLLRLRAEQRSRMAALEDDLQREECLRDWAEAHGEDFHDELRAEMAWADDGGFCA